MSPAIRPRLRALGLVLALLGCNSTSTNVTQSSTGGSGGAGGGSGGVAGDAAADGTSGCSEAELQSDPDNCGACGHGCLGGQCVQGHCQPVSIFANDPNTGAIGTLGPLVLSGSRLFVGDVGDQGATGSTGAVWAMDLDGKNVLRLDSPGTTEVSALATDAASLYWTSLEGHVSKVGKGGGTISELATESVALRGLAVTTNHVFYAAGSVIKQLYLIGNSSFDITVALANPAELALGGGHLYFTTMGTSPDFTDGTVSRVPVDLASPPSTALQTVEPLAVNQEYPRAIAVDGTYAYWLVRSGALRRMKLDGTDQIELVKGSEDPDLNPQSLVLSDDTAYWTSWGACAIAAGCNGGAKIRGRVQRIAKSGGSKQVLAEGDFLPTGIAVDASSVYWTNWWFTSLSRLAL